MDSLKKHWIEAVASLWMFIVAVQYIDRYVLRDTETDFRPAYIAVLCLTAAVVVVRRAIAGRTRR